MLHFIVSRTLLMTGVILLCSCSQLSLNSKSTQGMKLPEKIGENSDQDTEERVVKLVEQALQEDLKYQQFIADDLYLKASSAMMDENFQLATMYFKNLLKLKPANNYIKTKYAISLIRMGELNQSLMILEEIHKSQKGSDIRVSMVLAGVYSSLGEMGKAQKIYRKVIKDHPKEAEACIFLAKSLDIEKKFEQVIRTLNRCEKRNPKRGVFSYYIGKMYIDQGKFSKAKYFFKKSLKKEPDFSQSALALGLIEEEKGNYKAALKVYKDYHQKFSNDSLILNRIVQLLFAQEQYQDVVPYAEKLADLDPSNLNLKVRLGILYTDTGRIDEAIKVFQNLLEYAPNSDKILYYLGAIFQELGQYEQSVHYYAQIEPESVLYVDSSIQVANMLSFMASYNGNKRDGEGDLLGFIEKRSEKMPPLKVELHMIQANYYQNSEQQKSAIESLERVSSDEMFNNSHRYFLASLYEEEKNYEKSESLIRTILSEDPEDAHAWNFLGYSLLERGVHLDRAFGYIQKAVELAPEDGYIRDSLGWYYYKTGDLDSALKELQYAAEKEPDDVEIAKHLAIVYQVKKDYLKAKQYYITALQNSTKEREKNEIFNRIKSLEQNLKRAPAMLP